MSRYDKNVSMYTIATKYKIDPGTVSRVIERAKKRSKERGVPLLDITNVQNSPKKRGHPRKFTDA